ncbi:MAG TPA: hypothetical protein VGT78_07565 [Rhizomicrobium sp.]|nr:hypothetical protein [Rhizomicrobium sp.]
MPNYEICYLKDDGSLSGKFSAQCLNEKQAKILAHAMKLQGSRRIEVWDGKALVYQRPEKAN